MTLREDDKPETVKVRFDTFLKKTKPLFDFYSNKGIFHSVYSPTSPEGYKIIKPILENIIKSK